MISRITNAAISDELGLMAGDGFNLSSARGKMDPARPGWSVYEYRVAAQLRKELRGILGYDQPLRSR